MGSAARTAGKRVARMRRRLRCARKGHDFQNYLGHGVHCRRCGARPPEQRLAA